MSLTSCPAGRRERNKQAKFDRMLAAAGGLFAEHGVGDVTTQQVADRADIGTVTAFLYAIQNTHDAPTLEAGRRRAVRIILAGRCSDR